MIGESRDKIQKIEQVLHENVEKKKEKQLSEMEAQIGAYEERILKDAKEQAENIRTQAKEESSRIRRLAVTQARFRKDRELMKAREEKVKQILQEVEDRLTAFRKEEGYGNFLKRLIIEAAEAIPAQELVLYFNEEDRKIYEYQLQNDIASVLPDRKLRLDAENAACKGGVVVENAEGSRRVENTFELYLRQVEEEIGKELYKQFSQNA